MNQVISKITVKNSCKMAHSNLVNFGLPFQKSFCLDLSSITIIQSGKQIPYFKKTTAVWPDNSVKWANIQAIVYFPSGADIDLEIAFDPDNNSEPQPSIQARTDSNQNQPFVPSGHLPFAAILNILSENKKQSIKVSDSLEITETPIGTEIHCTGSLKEFLPNLHYHLELLHIKELSLCKGRFVLWNANAMRVKNGLWDLGDENAFSFNQIEIVFKPTSGQEFYPIWGILNDSGQFKAGEGDFEIKQHSSGGENWNSINHVDKTNRVAVAKKGFRWKADSEKGSGTRCQVGVSLRNDKEEITLIPQHFWQTFPNGVSVHNSEIVLEIMPDLNTEYEIQPGEKCSKAFVLYLRKNQESLESLVNISENPDRVIVPCSYIGKSGVVPFFTGDSVKKKYDDFVTHAIEGGDCFRLKNEKIDEFGWRNFGDIYADHEEMYYQGDQPLVSHYNNQYDVLSGLIIQYFRSGETVWLQMAESLAEHIINIDIYNTSEDKAAYNHGLFWHSDHYNNVHTATHRTYSKRHPNVSKGLVYGGGPSNEHNYTSGLMYWYHLTGDIRFRDAVVGLADWVINRDDGSKTILGYWDKGPTGLSSSTAFENYHGPGRGAGNSINALLDAYELTRNEKYMDYADILIRRTIHPTMDIEALNLRNLELRWSYLVYLQVLSKCLIFLLSEMNPDQERPLFTFVRHSLLAFSRWMLNNEKPNHLCLKEVEYPTETWIAHDMRKSQIFYTAAFFGQQEEKGLFISAARKYYDTCFEQLERFDTCYCTRPMAIVLNCGYTREFYESEQLNRGASWKKFTEKRSYQPFRTQKERCKCMLKTPIGWLKTLTIAIKPSFLKRLINKQF